MAKPFSFISTARIVVFLIAAVVAVTAQTASKSDVIDELRKIGLTESDLERLESGEPVIKELERSVRREVAIIGAMKLRFPFELAAKGLERAVDNQRRESAKEAGSFSRSPDVEDLASLEFDSGDIGDLRGCVVGGCEWNLSEEIIKALEAEVDWQADDAEARAEAILKRELVEYVRAYLADGNRSLMIYRDTDPAVDLGEEYQEIGPRIPFLNRFARPLAIHVRNYPADRPESTEEVLSWSEVKIGLKPVVMFTHTISYLPDHAARYSVSKQIFANHYIDSTLGLTALFGFPGYDGDPESLLIFVSRSRASALRGRLGGLMRGLIEDRAKGKLNEFMSDTRRFTELAFANRNADAEREANLRAERERSRIITLLWIAVPLVMAAGGIVLFLLLRKRAS